MKVEDEVKAAEHSGYTAAELTTATRRLDMALAEWHGELSEKMGMGTWESWPSPGLPWTTARVRASSPAACT